MTTTYPTIEWLAKATEAFEQTAAKRSFDYDKYDSVLINTTRFYKFITEHNKKYPKMDKSLAPRIGGRIVRPASWLATDDITFAIMFNVSPIPAT